jgi:hypothetical protein
MSIHHSETFELVPMDQACVGGKPVTQTTVALEELSFLTSDPSLSLSSPRFLGSHMDPGHLASVPVPSPRPLT